MEKPIALIALTILVTGFILLVISVNKGKRIVEYLKQRYPQQWEDMGNPAPGYLQSQERNRWMKFLWNRDYVQFNDKKLTEMGEAQRNLENIMLSVFFGFIFIGGIVAWFEWMGWPG